MSDAAITVFYDGLCPLCSREIAHYRAKVPGDAMMFVDIADPGFDASQHGLDLERARAVLHVKVGQEMRTGIDAVISMWDAMPAYRWLARLARLPGIHALTEIGYLVFARLRPHLQRQRNVCTTDTCGR